MIVDQLEMNLNWIKLAMINVDRQFFFQCIHQGSQIYGGPLSIFEYCERFEYRSWIVVWRCVSINRLLYQARISGSRHSWNVRIHLDGLWQLECWTDKKIPPCKNEYILNLTLKTNLTFWIWPWKQIFAMMNRAYACIFLNTEKKKVSLVPRYSSWEMFQYLREMSLEHLDVPMKYLQSSLFKIEIQRRKKTFV